jgi:hypothetical protein
MPTAARQVFSQWSIHGAVLSRLRQVSSTLALALLPGLTVTLASTDRNVVKNATNSTTDTFVLSVVNPGHYAVKNVSGELSA